MKTLDYCTNRCFLCDEVNSQESLSYFLELYEDPKDKILFESPHFVAMPDINPIVSGHTLLVPKRHILSLSQLQPDEWLDFKQIRKLLLESIQKEFNTFFMFEHGTVNPEVSSGICVQHAHLHIIPVNIEDMHVRLQPYTKEAIKIVPVDMETTLTNISESYLYYEDANGNGCLVRLNNPLPQQFVRRLVAESLGLPDWDWKSIALPYLQ